MISLMREFTKSWIFKLVLLLLVVSFAVYGVRDVFSSVGTNSVVTAGKRSVSVDEFKRIFENNKQNYAQQNGGKTFTNEEFVAAGQHLRLLAELADSTALSAWLDSLGIKPSPKLIVEEIGKNPSFANNVTGKFDKDAYRQLLAQNHLDEATFERDVSDGIASAQYSDAALAGLKSPRIYAATEAAFNMETRDASFFVLSPGNVANPPQPTDVDVKTFYQVHQAQLVLPELRQASLVTFTPDQFAKDIPADEAVLQKMYKFELDSLSTPETRTFLEITAPDAASAAAISAALKAGQDPAAAAQAHKGQVLPYTQKPKTAVPDSKIAAAAFALQTGDVSGPITGDLGFAVIKMGEIKTGATPSFDSVRPKLLAEYQNNKALDKVNEVANAFQKAHDAGEDFDATAKRLGLKVISLPQMTAQGKTGNPQVDYSKFTPIVKTIYDQSQGGVSDVEEMGHGQSFAVKVNTITPAGAPPFEKIKPDLIQAWRAEKMGAAIQAAADAATQRLQNGEAFTKVAADLKGEIKTIPGLDRNTGAKKVGDQIIGRVFMAKTGDTFQASVSQYAIAIGHVDAVHQADLTAANVSAATIRPQMSNLLARDIADLTRTAARQAVKTKTYPDLAQRTLGVNPPDTKDAKTTKDKS